MLSKEDQSSLLDLARHWDRRMPFTVVDGVWQAVPAMAPSVVITADTSEELREKVRQDYSSRRSTLGPIRGERMST
jgi:hypothetical protein